jgi:hypothetical protein
MAWVLGAIFILCIIGSWISYIMNLTGWDFEGLKRFIRSIRRSLHNPVYLNRQHFEDLKSFIGDELHDLHSHGIPDEYIDRYEKLTHVDYFQYRKGIRQLVKDMKNNGFDTIAMEEIVKSLINIYYDA